MQIDSSGYHHQYRRGMRHGQRGTGSTGQIAYYPGNGTALAGMAAVPVGSGGTGATTAAAALATLGGLALSGGAIQGMITLSGDPTLPLHPATKQYTDNSIAAASTAATAAQAQASSANAAAASALSGSANDATARSAASSAQSTANSALPANGCTTTPGGNVTCPGVAKVRTTISGDLPLLDIRHPSFAGGATCDGVTDIGPALQAAVNSLPSQGGEIILTCGSSFFHLVLVGEPYHVQLGHSLGTNHLLQQGVLHTGTTLALTSLNTAVQLYRQGRLRIAHFRPRGVGCYLRAAIEQRSGHRALCGTAVTSANVPTTVTLSSMNGIYPGAAIEVVNKTSCTASTITRAGNQSQLPFRAPVTFLLALPSR